MTAVRTKDGLTVTLEVRPLGRDLLAVLTGGAEHIGCTVLAIPRPSLADPDRTSATSSVLNCVGHKDEYPCRKVAEALCSRTGATVVCTGGLHVDGAGPEQLRCFRDLVDQVLEEALAALCP